MKLHIPSTKVLRSIEFKNDAMQAFGIRPVKGPMHGSMKQLESLQRLSIDSDLWTPMTKVDQRCVRQKSEPSAPASSVQIARHDSRGAKALMGQSEVSLGSLASRSNTTILIYPRHMHVPGPASMGNAQDSACMHNLCSQPRPSK